MTLNQLDREPLDKHQPPLLLTSHPEACDARFLGVHSSLSPGSPRDDRAFSLPVGSPRPRDPLDGAACSQALFQLLLPRHSLRPGTSLSPNLLTHKGA